MRLRRIGALLLVAVTTAGCGRVQGPGAVPGPSTTAYQGPSDAERAAQSDLRNALATAKVYFTGEDTYSGFDAESARGIEPSLAWSDGVAVPRGEDAVGIAFADPLHVVMNADSSEGDIFCIADEAVDPGSTVRGRGAATTYAECASLTDW